MQNFPRSCEICFRVSCWIIIFYSIFRSQCWAFCWLFFDSLNNGNEFVGCNTNRSCERGAALEFCKVGLFQNKQPVATLSGLHRLVLSSITFPGQCNRWVRKAEPEKAQISARNAVEYHCSVQIGDKPDLQSPPRPRSSQPPLPSLASLSSLKMRDRQNRDTWCIWT